MIIKYRIYDIWYAECKGGGWTTNANTCKSWIRLSDKYIPTDKKIERQFDLDIDFFLISETDFNPSQVCKDEDCGDMIIQIMDKEDEYLPIHLIEFDIIK